MVSCFEKYQLGRSSATISCVNSNIDAKSLESWKKAFAKSGITYKTDDEYKEAIYNLVGYVETLIEMDKQQKAAQSKVADTPKT